jgi:folliculin
MNELVAVCHFCEKHGPRTLHCTQAFSGSPTVDELVGGELAEDAESYYSSTTPSPASTRSQSSLSRRVSLDSGSATQSVTQQSLSKPSEESKCNMCGWFETVPGFISHDHSTHTSYVTSHRPHDTTMFSYVRQACVRSLSCEVFAVKDAPIVIGDETNGYFLAFKFILPDFQARGFQRPYSIVILAADSARLVASFSFLSSRIQQLVRRLQAAVRIFLLRYPSIPLIASLLPSFCPAIVLAGKQN